MATIAGVLGRLVQNRGKRLDHEIQNTEHTDSEDGSSDEVFSLAPPPSAPDHAKKKLRPAWGWLPSRRIPSVRAKGSEIGFWPGGQSHVRKSSFRSVPSRSAGPIRERNFRLLGICASLRGEELSGSLPSSSSSTAGIWAHFANGSSRSRLCRTWLRNAGSPPVGGTLGRSDVRRILEVSGQLSSPASSAARSGRSSRTSFPTVHISELSTSANSFSSPFR